MTDIFHIKRPKIFQVIIRKESRFQTKGVWVLEHQGVCLQVHLILQHFSATALLCLPGSSAGLHCRRTELICNVPSSTEYFTNNSSQPASCCRDTPHSKSRTQLQCATSCWQQLPTHGLTQHRANIPKAAPNSAGLTEGSPQKVTQRSSVTEFTHCCPCFHLSMMTATGKRCLWYVYV